ncbi:MAG: hypothetical protein ACLR78_06700 [Roseburia sp.]
MESMRHVSCSGFALYGLSAAVGRNWGILARDASSGAKTIRRRRSCSMIFWWMAWEKRGGTGEVTVPGAKNVGTTEVQEKLPEIMECLIGEILGEN